MNFTNAFRRGKNAPEWADGLSDRHAGWKEVSGMPGLMENAAGDEVRAESRDAG